MMSFRTLALIATALLTAQTPAAPPQTTWVLENPDLQVSVNAEAGALTILDKRSKRAWKQPVSADKPATPRFTNVQHTEAERSLAFDAQYGLPGTVPSAVTVKLTLAPSGGDLAVTVTMPAGTAAAENVPLLDPFALDAPRGVLVVADFCDGHLYPLDAQPFPQRWFSSMARLDMTWVGVCDLDRGDGYMIILETSDDSTVIAQDVKPGDRQLVAPRPIWRAQRTKAGASPGYSEPCRLTYHFLPRGGYVAMAKRYREHARERGLLVSLSEKAQKNPNVARLFGAPHVWGFGSCTLDFAKQAKAAGVEKMLIHTDDTVVSPDDMRSINALGYLTSAYDNYCDVVPIEANKPLDSQHDLVPENAVLNADGRRMNAWLTWDGKHQYMKRCPSRWRAAAEAVIPSVLKTRPYLGRFIDVVTADELHECCDPNHPLTRARSRECGQALYSYAKSLGLVTGGEHGIWWAVPQVDYFMGMMTGGYYYPYPAAHLIRPESKTQQFKPQGGETYPSWATYEQWSMGHAHRVPLWELVFHDCAVSTWYWGDSNDFLLKAAPELTEKKDAFNILYGTPPLLWANAEGGWGSAREAFLQTCRNTAKLHEALATAELLSHEFVTPDHAVQRTRFSDGTEVIVNFGTAPFEAERGGTRHLLPQNGFAVKGPRIEQRRELLEGRVVTTIHAGDYHWSDN